MTVEIVQAIGEHIVTPLAVAAAFIAAFFWAISR